MKFSLTEDIQAECNYYVYDWYCMYGHCLPRKCSCQQEGKLRISSYNLYVKMDQIVN